MAKEAGGLRRNSSGLNANMQPLLVKVNKVATKTQTKKPQFITYLVFRPSALSFRLLYADQLTCVHMAPDEAAASITAHFALI